MRSSLLAVSTLLAACLPAAPVPVPSPADGSPPAALDGGLDPVPIDPSACDRYDCSNPVDAVLVPMLAGAGLELVEEAPAILCRRLAIDLTGQLPTAEEATGVCLSSTPAALVDYFFGKTQNAIAIDGSAPYVFVNRRAWARLFSYDPGPMRFVTFYVYLRALDRLVGDLYAGTIRYDEFVRRAVVSPAFLKRFGNFDVNDARDLTQIAAQAYRLFLGREALPAEAASFGNLFRGWAVQIMDEDTSFATYPDCPYGIRPSGDDSCTHWELGLRGDLCAGASAIACSSTVLGSASMVPPDPGFVRWADFSPELETLVETPGRLLIARPELAEAAVDRALSHYLGWWKAGTYRPDFDLPAVRAVLAQRFVADGYDVRALDRLILTSLLYRQAATRADRPNAPLWAFGPTKVVDAATWMDNTAIATGARIEVFDFRYGNYPMFVDHFKNLPGQVYYGYRIGTQQDLGDDGGLLSVFTRRAVLEDQCSGDGTPADASFDQLIDRAFAGVGRAATADERARITTALTEPGGDGCPTGASCDRATTARALCRSLFASSLYTFF